MLPMPFAAIVFKYDIVVKPVLNVVSATVFVAAELTAGNAAAATLPTIATAAKALAVLNFIPNSFLTSVEAVNDYLAFLCKKPKVSTMT
jgi:hypothetical protein